LSFFNDFTAKGAKEFTGFQYVINNCHICDIPGLLLKKEPLFILMLCTSCTLLLLVEMADIPAYHDLGPSHIDSSALTLIHSLNNNCREPLLSNNLPSPPIPPTFSSRIDNFNKSRVVGGDVASTDNARSET